MKKTFTNALFLFSAVLLGNSLRAQTISGGMNFSATICNDNTVKSWGYNGEGQLGDSTYINRTSPVSVFGLSNVTAVASGAAHTLALKSDGTVWAWGYNVYSSLGSGTPGGDEQAPIQVAGLTNIIAISAGGYHSLALKSDGTLWSWGSNFAGELGDGTTVSARSTPVQVTGISGVVAISAGAVHSMALKSDGAVYAWGYNVDGRIDDGTTTNRFSPVLVSGLSGVSKIGAGGTHSLAIKNDGTVWAWGKNSNGQLGDGTYTDHSLPTLIAGITNAISVKGGETHSLALKSDGTVWAWGRNDKGQLGDGSTTQKNSPVQVLGVSGINTIACGVEHSLALKSDGTLWTWGYNDKSQLGDGTVIDQVNAVQAIGLCTAAIASGIESTENELEFSLYPNPSSGVFSIETAAGQSMITVYNSLGQVIYSASIASKEQLDLSSMPAGVYIIRVITEEGAGTKRFVISK